MPMVSQAQRKFLWATNPKLAREFEDATKNGIKLPDHVVKTIKAKKTKLYSKLTKK